MPLTFAGDAVQNTWTLCVAGGVLTLVQGAVCCCAHASVGTWEWGCAGVNSNVGVVVLAAVIGRSAKDPIFGYTTKSMSVLLEVLSRQSIKGLVRIVYNSLLPMCTSAMRRCEIGGRGRYAIGCAVCLQEIGGQRASSFRRFLRVTDRPGSGSVLVVAAVFGAPCSDGLVSSMVSAPAIRIMHQVRVADCLWQASAAGIGTDLANLDGRSLSAPHDRVPHCTAASSEAEPFRSFWRPVAAADAGQRRPRRRSGDLNKTRTERGHMAGTIAGANRGVYCRLLFLMVARVVLRRSAAAR